jgi:hypothetical protein
MEKSHGITSHHCTIGGGIEHRRMRLVDGPALTNTE